MTTLLSVTVNDEPSSQLNWDKNTKVCRDALLQLDERRKHGANVELICPCNQYLILRVLGRDSPTPQPVLASRPDDEHDNSRCLCHQKRKQPLLDLKDLLSPEDAFTNREESFATWRVRFARVHKDIAKKTHRVTDQLRRSQSSRPSPYSYRCIGGIFDTMAETAALCRYEPERSYGTDIESTMLWMQSQCMACPSFRDAIMNRAVIHRRGFLAKDLSAAQQKNASALGEHLLVIFRANFGQQKEGAWTTANETVELKHSQIVETRLAKPATMRLIHFVKNNPDANMIVAALVRCLDGEYIVDDCAWRLVDRFGIIYESPAEFRAGQQLIAGRISFAKPVRTLYRVSGHRHIPDFILFGAERSFVLEVDPSAGIKTTIRKIRRDLHYLEDGIRSVNWSGKKDDLLAVLEEAGFQP